MDEAKSEASGEAKLGTRNKERLKDRPDERVSSKLLGSKIIDQAVLLAAGLGSRLAPLSTIRPKPLFPVVNQSMLWRWLAKLRDGGISQVVVNAHYLADLIQAELELARSAFPELTIRLSFEPTILGTGGGVKQAASSFKGSFLVVNSDIYTDLNLDLLVKDHIERQNLVTMAVLDYPEKATVSVDQDWRIIGLRQPNPCPRETAKWCGLGVMVIEEPFLDYLPHGYSDLVAELAKSLKYPVGAFGWPGFWSDMGTIASYWALNGHLAQNQTVLGPGAEVWGKTEGFVVLGAGARIHSGALVANSVLWPGALVESGAVVKDAIVVGQVPVNKEVRDVWLG
jgi:mannose-1-phosphate guanylyltransferase